MTDELLKFYKKKYKSKISSTRGRRDKLGNEIQVKLSLDEFIKLYEDVGALPMMPYVLSRIDDIGHYEIGNVFVSINSQNSAEAHGLYDEDTAQLSHYCFVFKYKRVLVKKAIATGRLTWEEVYSLKPIK